MDTQGLLPPPVKVKRQRRQHSLQFKKQVVTASYTPGVSIAGVARQFNVNANLVHNWRKQLGKTQLENPDFIKVALPARSDESISQAGGATLRVDIASPMGLVTLHWPMDRLSELSVLLKPSL